MRDLLPLPPSPPGLIVLTGPDACLTVGLLLALQGAVATRPLLVIDAANAFDPYLISDLARRLRLPPQRLLEQIRISRVFTCYQLEALLEERLPRVREHLDPYGLFLSGPLEPLLDEEVRQAEAVLQPQRPAGVRLAHAARQSPEERPAPERLEPPMFQGW